MNRQDVEILETHQLCDRFLKVTEYRLRHKLFQGGWSATLSREIVTRPQVAAVLPYDPVLDKVVLIEQFRIGALNDPYSPWQVEVVAGIAEEGESMEALAQREMQEEAGLVVLDLKLIHRYWTTAGMSDEQVSLYCATVDASQAGGVFGLAGEHEDIKVHVMSSTEAFELLEDGRIYNATLLVALQWLKLYLR